MEIEDLQKIWNEQKGENMYAINESALHHSIHRKKESASRKINRVEIGISLINGIVAIILFIDALNDTHNWDFIAAAIFASTVVYIQFARQKRIKGEQDFDRSMLGELDHAISNTNAIIRFNFLMMAGYMLPVLLFNITKMLDTGISWERGSVLAGMFLLAFGLIMFERKRILLPSKRKLEKLKEKLEKD